ncbi:MAG: argininosuccinate lyase [Candidatus Dormibacteria bacterium]
MPRRPDPVPTQPGFAKAWSGRLQGGTNPTLEEYTSSLLEDRELAPQDLAGSRAHAMALFRAGLLDEATKDLLLAGLTTVAVEISSGGFKFLGSDEDIHMAVERRLTELLGEPARRLHTGRSRNDQVALDLRLWAKQACLRLVSAGAGAQAVLLARARRERRTLLPGYTHLQRAQPVHLAHHLLAYFEMLERDLERLRECQHRLDRSPLGAGALAGTTLAIDRSWAAAELGFGGLTGNSLDAVSDRDFAVEIVFCCALIGVHLSRLAEDLILWNTREFSFVSLPDSWATGSSLMPQKKNPDVLELVRGRAARPISSLVGLLTVLKGLPLSYNRDLQEDKHHLFGAVAATEASLLALTGLLGEVVFNRESMELAAQDPELLATDLAEHLVARGVAFRQAHELVGRAVRRAEELGQGLDVVVGGAWRELGLPDDPVAAGVFDVRASLRRREQPGAPGPKATELALTAAARRLRRTSAWLRGQDQ